jgi:uncharacterized protein YndB with AHSA1/START domain
MHAIHGRQIELDGRPALRFERPLRHSVDRVWRAVSEPAELAQWFVGPVDWVPEAGERREVYGQTMEVTVVQPPHRLEWTWGGERYAFELRADGDGTLLVFTHVFDPPSGPIAQHAAGWETYLDRLAALLAGAPLAVEDAHGPVGDYHERYARALGVDPAPGRRTFAGLAFRGLHVAQPGVLHLRRRLAHEPQRVWRALTDPAELAHWFPELDQLEVVEQDPPRLLVARWFGLPLRIELTPAGEATILDFAHEFGEPGTEARSAAGWDRCFFALDALLAGHPVDRATSLELWPDVHERYAEAFGVDPEVGRAAFAQATAGDA